MKSALPFYSVACGIVVRRRKVLIAERKTPGYYGGFWEFPGGKVKPEETVASALARELREELGIEIRHFSLWKKVPYRYPERRVMLHFYLCAWPGGPLRPMACDGLKWVFPGQIRRYPFLPANQRIVRELEARVI